MPFKFSSRAALAGSRVVRLALYGFTVAALAGCGDSVGPEPVRNFVRLESDPGEFIGGGQTLVYTQSNAILDVTVLFNVVSVTVQGDESWTGAFAIPSPLPLQNGTYSGATRYPFNSPESPGLSWSGEGRGCNTLTGSFTIDSVAYTDEVLTSIDVRFEQHCEGAPAALRGTIRWRADEPVALAGPVWPVPTGLWRPDPASVPASGDYVLLASDPGDYIGQGEFRVYTPANSQITVASSENRITVGVGGYTGTFVGMLGTVPLTRGYYGDLMRFPFHNPAKGGLDWSGNGRGCNTLTGWFAIDRIVYTGTTLTALEMRFEQHCDGAVPALRGSIRWSA